MDEPFFEACQSVTIPANKNVELFARVRNVEVGDIPIAVLLHGYPQSSFM